MTTTFSYWNVFCYFLQLKDRLNDAMNTAFISCISLGSHGTWLQFCALEANDCKYMLTCFGFNCVPYYH